MQKSIWQTSSTPEFDGWRWVSYWYPVRQVVSFKRDVYRRVMKEFARCGDVTAGKYAKTKNASAYRRKEVKSRQLCSLACAEIVEKGSQRTTPEWVLKYLWLPTSVLRWIPRSVRSTWPIIIDVVTTDMATRG